ncbi:MAG: TolB family protein, partial [Gemmatimonadales bacterium]
MALDDLAKLVRLSDPQVAPSGREIAFLAARPNYETNRWETELVVAELPGGAQRVLVTGRSGLSRPRWGPAGDRLAFLADVDGRAQVHVIARDGGEARAVTRAPEGVRQFAWRPDGTAIAYIARDTVPAP